MIKELLVALGWAKEGTLERRAERPANESIFATLANFLRLDLMARRTSDSVSCRQRAQFRLRDTLPLQTASQTHPGSHWVGSFRWRSEVW